MSQIQHVSDDSFEEEVFDDDVHSISATKIRKKMREDGEL